MKTLPIPTMVLRIVAGALLLLMSAAADLSAQCEDVCGAGRRDPFHRWEIDTVVYSRIDGNKVPPGGTLGSEWCTAIIRYAVYPCPGRASVVINSICSTCPIDASLVQMFARLHSYGDPLNIFPNTDDTVYVVNWILPMCIKEMSCGSYYCVASCNCNGDYNYCGGNCCMLLSYRDQHCGTVRMDYVNPVTNPTMECHRDLWPDIYTNPPDYCDVMRGSEGEGGDPVPPTGPSDDWQCQQICLFARVRFPIYEQR